MQLLTSDFINKMKEYPFYSQRVDNPLVISKIYVCDIVWFILELDVDLKKIYTYRTWLYEDTFCYQYLPELEKIPCIESRNWLEKIEFANYDLNFKPKLLQDIISEINFPHIW